MADKKGTELDAVSTLAATDLVLGVQLGTPNKTVKIQRQALIKKAYGQLSVTGGAAAQTLTSTPAKVTAWTAEVSGLNVVADHADNTIGLSDAGEYLATLGMVLDVSAADTFRFQFYWNGTAQGVYAEHIRAGTGRFTVTLSTRISALAAAQKLELRASAASGADITIAEGVMTADRVD